MELIKRLIKEEEGQGLVEYALLIGLISIVAVLAITNAGKSVKNLWNNVSNALTGI